MQLETMLGIYETGGIRAPWLPRDTRRTLELWRSIDYTIPLEVVNTQGVPVVLTATGTSVIMRIKKRVIDHAPIYAAALTLSAGRPGKGYFTLPAATFDFVVDGSYIWEVMLTLDSLRSPLIPLSPCILQPSGSRYAC